MNNDKTEKKLKDIIKKLTLEDKVSLLTGGSFWSLPEIKKISLLPLFMSDGPIGIRGTLWTNLVDTVLPNPSSLAATFDIKLAYKVGSTIANY